MNCLICTEYRQALLDDGHEPFTFDDANEPGWNQPPSDVAERHQDFGCEPICEDGQWMTYCDLATSDDAHERDSVRVLRLVIAFALHEWVRIHCRHPDAVASDEVEAYLGEWVELRDGDTLADGTGVAAGSENIRKLGDALRTLQTG